MIYFAHIDKENNILGWYCSQVHEEIPKPNIEVTEQVWSQALDVNANYYDAKDDIFILKEKQPQTKEEVQQAKEYSRIQRNRQIDSVAWLIQRHTQERELGIKTTLSDTEYKELLAYIQQLRDHPSKDNFWDTDLPAQPSFIS